jgi:hypothetical protein
MYSSAEICDDCKETETKRPDYKAQVELDERMYLERLKTMKGQNK